MTPRRRVLTEAALTAAALLAAAGCAAPGAGGTGTRDAGEATGVVTGVVLAAPACPVERVDEPCPPRPVAGALVEAFDGNDARGTTRTDDDGAFRLELPHSSYAITATNTGLPSTDSEEVTVSEAPVKVELVVDSGIR